MVRLLKRFLKILDCNRFLFIPIEILLGILDYLFPKDDNLVICGSSHGRYRSGSPKFFADYLEKNTTRYRVFYYLPFHESMDNKSRFEYIVRFAPVFFRARFLISSHPPVDFYPFIGWSSRKIMINFWHGIPLKAMFFADRKRKRNDLSMISRLNRKTDAFIVSSRLEAALIAECFLIDPSKFYYTGQPRNDCLHRRGTSQCIDEVIPSLHSYDRVILYAPTYRRDSESAFFPFQDFDLKDLEKFLRINNVLLVLRRHPYDNATWDFCGDNIIEAGPDKVEDPNDLLPYVDILITDYSSIYFDYLLLDRPCILVQYDRNHYSEHRGLLFDDCDFWRAGYNVESYNDFEKVLSEIFSGADVFAVRRNQLCRIFHYHQTTDSSKRVINLMDSLLEGRRS